MRSRDINSQLRILAAEITPQSTKLQVLAAMVRKYKFLQICVTARNHGGVEFTDETCPCCAKYSYEGRGQTGRFGRRECPAYPCMPVVNGLRFADDFKDWEDTVYARLLFWEKKLQALLKRHPRRRNSK